MHYHYCTKVLSMIEKGFSSDFEESNLKELHTLSILNVNRAERFERYTMLVKDIFNVPIVLISLVDSKKKRLNSCIGLEHNAISEVTSFCEAIFRESEILIIPDTLKNVHFQNSSLVNKP